MKRLWFLLVIAALLVVPLNALAQGDEQEWEEYTSEDELLTLSYPSGWTVGAVDGMPFPMIYIGRSDELVARALEGGDIKSGDVSAFIMIMPMEILYPFLDLPEEYDAVDLLNTYFIMDDATDTTLNDLELIEIEQIDEEPIEVATGVMTSIEVEGRVFLYEKDELLFLTGMVAYPGEYSDDQDDLGMSILKSIQYDSTGDELMTVFENQYLTEDQE